MAELQREEIGPPLKANGWGVGSHSGYLAPFTFYRRAPRKDEVTIKVLFCGICPADRRSINSHNSEFPRVPGHEIVGEVIDVGDKELSKFKLGDKVGVGCMIGHLHSCSTDKNCTSFDRNKNCMIKPEKYCSRTVITYFDGSRKYGPGGFSDIVVVKERFVVRFPENFPLDGGAPLLCAGVTVYGPMKFYGLDKSGLHLGVVELGRLGYLAVKFAKALGLKVTVISDKLEKEKEAIECLGADSFILIHNLEQMQAARSTMDGIINTLPLSNPMHHDRALPLTCLLKCQGKMIQLGDPDIPIDLPELSLFWERKLCLGGSSATKQTRKTQEMVDFAAKHNITADVKVIRMDYVKRAMERIDNKADEYAGFYFVVDIANSSLSAPPRFEIKKWNAVARWAREITVENCAICKNHIWEQCLECQADAADTDAVADDSGQASSTASASAMVSSSSNTKYLCNVVSGVCNHAYHSHCIMRWLTTRKVCPLDNRQWMFSSLSHQQHIQV